jgi:hypothetical protein
VVRPFVSLLVAVVGTLAGLVLTWFGSVARAQAAPGDPDAGALALMVAGALVLGSAALSLALHWVGALLVGAIHGVLGMLALAVPFGNPFGGGIFSPVFQITRMLGAVDRALGDGAAVFYFSGAALVVGAFLVGAALGVRSRRLAAPASGKARAVSSVAGFVTVLAAIVLLVVAGGGFVRSILMMLRYDGALAALAVVGGVLAGIAGLLLRWSSAGVIVAGALALVAGLALLASPGMPGTVWSGHVAAYGLLAGVGATALAAGLGGAVRAPGAVSDEPDAL